MKSSAAAIVAFALVAAGSALAAPTGLEVVQPWSRPAAAGTTGVGYMVLVNHGRRSEVLEKVESPLAARVEIHSSSMSGGVMFMKKEDKVSVPAGGKADFGPGAYHLMLIGLTKALQPGDRAPATLVFASGARLKTAFTVSSGMGPPTAPPHDRH